MYSPRTHLRPLDDIARLSGAADWVLPSCARCRTRADHGPCVPAIGSLSTSTPRHRNPRALQGREVGAKLATAARTPREDVRLRHLWGRNGLVDLFSTAAGLESHGHRRARNRRADAPRRTRGLEDRTTPAATAGRAAERASATSRRVATRDRTGRAGRSVVAVGSAWLQLTWDRGRTRAYSSSAFEAYAQARAVSALNALGTGRVVCSTSGRPRIHEGRGIGWSQRRRSSLCSGVCRPRHACRPGWKPRPDARLALMRDTESSRRFASRT